METIRGQQRALVAVILSLGFGVGNRVPAETLRMQTLALRAGWNAVFLEVQPAAPQPAEVFRGLPVDSAACFLPGSQGERYLRRPGDAPWKEEGWTVWYAPDRPEAFLSTLQEIQAGRAYLIHAGTAFTWQVTGEARAPRLEWQADSCTLTGLPVSESAPPTFTSFFAGSPAHQRHRVYQLQDDTWRLLRDPAQTAIRRGEAYWIQTDTTSAYQGPIQVNLPASGILDFEATSAAADLRLANVAPTRARLRLDVITTADALPLRRVVRDLASLTTTRPPLLPVNDLGDLAPGGSVTVRLEPDRDAMAGAAASTLLRLSDDRGWECWVPVRARRTWAASTARP